MTTSDVMPPGCRLLIVDDEMALLSPMRRYFERVGCIVATAQTAAEARALLSSETFDLVILDLRLGENERDGLDVLIEARRTGGMPVLILSGLATTDLEIEALDLGADRVLPKPQPLKELSRVANELMATR